MGLAVGCVTDFVSLKRRQKARMSNIAHNSGFTRILGFLSPALLELGFPPPGVLFQNQTRVIQNVR